MQGIAVLATVVMALSTVAALAWGVWTYRRGAEAQTQALALQLLQHHLDLALTHPDLASRAEDDAIDARYAWFAAHALVTAQTLWSIARDRPEWRRSIDAIIRQHRAYLRSGAFVCEDFDPLFVAYLRARTPGLKCAAAGA